MYNCGDREEVFGSVQVCLNPRQPDMLTPCLLVDTPGLQQQRAFELHRAANPQIEPFAGNKIIVVNSIYLPGARSSTHNHYQLLLSASSTVESTRRGWGWGVGGGGGGRDTAHVLSRSLLSRIQSYHRFSLIKPGVGWNNYGLTLYSSRQGSTLSGFFPLGSFTFIFPQSPSTIK